jgi:hypothetical protein
VRLWPRAQARPWLPIFIPLGRRPSGDRALCRCSIGWRIYPAIGRSRAAKRPSPATAISIVALFFSLGGVSLAVGHYLITSTNQIKPSVLDELRGGRAGATRLTQALAITDVYAEALASDTGLTVVVAKCPKG